MYKSSKLTIYNDLDYVDGVVCYLREICTKLGLNIKETNRMCYAVEESLSNTISHYVDMTKKESIDIEINSVSSGIQVVLNDFGSFDGSIQEVPEKIDSLIESISFDDISKENKESIDKISNYVIHKVLDRYRCTIRTDGNRTIEMTVFSSKDKVDSNETDFTTKDEVFESIRFANDKDAKGISKLFHKKFGYTYPNEVVYYPARLQELLRGISLISVIAISNRKNIIAHAALLRPYKGSRITEFGLLIGDEGFDNYEMILKLSERILQVAFSSSYYGLFFHPVLNLEFSKEFCKTYSFHDVALLVGYWNSNTLIESINTRASTTISFKLLRDIGETKLHLPSRHEKIIRKLYRNLGIEIKSRFYEVVEPAQRSTITDIISPLSNSAEITVKTTGLDLVEQVSNTTKRFSLAKIDVVYLYLNMEDKNSMDRISDFERLGYFFVGIFPLYHHKHTLVMEYINDIVFDYDSIPLHSFMAKELRDYIQKLDPNQKEK